MQPTQREEFEKLLFHVKADILEYIGRQDVPKEVASQFEKCLIYNIEGGKWNRGLSVLDSGRDLLQRDLSGHEFHALGVLGWLTELLQAFFLVHDDIMDDSITRRGQPCWFRRPDVGLMAVNDAVLLESSIFLVLRTRFSSHPAYMRLIETFHEASFHTALGQLCGMMAAPEDEVKFAKFSMSRYESIVRCKTTYYSFYLPVDLALCWLALDTPQNLEQTYQIMLKMGHYFQVQDDYLDVFGDSSVTGKVGTDIQDNKCSWLINKGLSLATEEQRDLLNENYGRKDEGCEQRVRQLFIELALPRHFQEFEESRKEELLDIISAVDESEGLRQQISMFFFPRYLTDQTKLVSS